MKRTGDDEEEEYRQEFLDLLIKGGMPEDLAQKLLEPLSEADRKTIEQTDRAKYIRDFWTLEQFKGLRNTLARMMYYRKLQEGLEKVKKE